MKGVRDVVCPWCKKPLFTRINNGGQVEKRCTSCGKWLPATREFFYIGRQGRGGLQSQCKLCRKNKEQLYQQDRKMYRKDYYIAHKEQLAEIGRNYYQQHKEEVAIRGVVNQKKRSQAIKTEVLTYYGAGRLACVWCGFNNIDALSIDHINGGGNRHRAELGRKGLSFYYWLKINGFPEGYQTLCMNCQMLKKQEDNVKRQESEDKEMLDTFDEVPIRYSDDVVGYMKQYRRINRSTLRLKARVQQQSMKLEVLSHYSKNGCVCVLCGYGDIRALTIDHIWGNGLAHLREIGVRSNIYHWLKTNGFPEGYQTLCMSCQIIKKITNKEYGI